MKRCSLRSLSAEVSRLIWAVPAGGEGLLTDALPPKTRPTALRHFNYIVFAKNDLAMQLNFPEQTLECVLRLFYRCFRHAERFWIEFNCIATLEKRCN
jgi:hypothetical protein